MDISRKHLDMIRKAVAIEYTSQKSRGRFAEDDPEEWKNLLDMIDELLLRQ